MSEVIDVPVETKQKPQRLDQIDMLRAQNYQLKLQMLTTSLDNLRAQVEQFDAFLQQKYELGTKDQLNLESGEIVRS